ncbi:MULTISPECIES: ferredoxin [Streptomyces]|uniref:ferredoxin n=1 Tax=Streptomyces TaxID=1883 RepID=UPI0002FA0E0E|nr:MULTISPECIES: ferredoxin [Streptomyces]MBP5934173.1 ferredoxin [Streptomyces sp. LBUM 1479]MBP5896255.1 ferredoxin [Streptomyces sp. LBUM 1481]MBP5910948.1 ferredoxin [Streptomyces sp. LBUM 1486]MBP5926591.1 ferredoxin [Streptomyces sp. LBUM 1483]MDX2539622.1 ferredoxin [Streptomyces scabiei]
MSIELIPGRCEGHAVCEAIAPEVFRVDDDGMVQLVPGGDHAAATALAAARSCPVAALRATS